MRKLAAGLSAAILMLGVLSATAVAADPVNINVSDATLMAKGAAVRVDFDIVCSGDNPFIEYGYARVTQRVSRGMVTTGQDESWTYTLWTTPLVCDGSTINKLSAIVSPETTMAFKSGIAIVEVYAFMFGQTWRTTLEMQLKR
jgi:hypothetical protein